MRKKNNQPYTTTQRLGFPIPRRSTQKVQVFFFILLIISIWERKHIRTLGEVLFEKNANLGCMVFLGWKQKRSLSQKIHTHLHLQNTSNTWHKWHLHLQNTSNTWHKCLLHLQNTSNTWHKCLLHLQNTSNTWHKCLWFYDPSLFQYLKPYPFFQSLPWGSTSELIRIDVTAAVGVFGWNRKPGFPKETMGVTGIHQ